MQNEMLERDLPPYLAHDLEAWKKGVEGKSAYLAARHEALFAANGVGP